MIRLFLLLQLTACASSAQPPPAYDLSSPPDLTFFPDLLRPPTPKDLSPEPPDLFGLCDQLGLKVNELQTAGATSTDEWIELYNPCPRSVPLDGAHLVYRSATNGTPNDTAVLAELHGTLLSNGYWVVTNGGATFSGNQMFAGGNDLNVIGGAIGIRDRDGNLADSVGWGSANNTFVETASVGAPVSNRSIGRLPNGRDTQNNAADWATTTAKTPGASN